MSLPQRSGPPPDRELRLVARREHTLLSLIELSHELSVSLDVRRTADLVLLNLMGHFGATRAALWLLPEAEGDKVVRVHSYGMDVPAAERLGAPLAAALAARFGIDRSPVRIDARPATDCAPAVAEAARAGITLVAPVRARGLVLGMLALGGRLGGEPYRSIDLQYVGAAAGLAGAAIENSRLYRQVTETNRELREANEHLLELDSARSQLVQNVNHELRTPLTVIIGFLEPMLDDRALPERTARALAAALQQAQHLAGLIENLLDFSASATGGVPLELLECDPRPLLLAIGESRQANVVEGLRVLHVEIADPLPRVRIDPRRLRQAIQLLFDNAVKFTPRGSTIRFAAAPLAADGHRWVAIDVEDDGPGIPPDQLHRLFHPFRQGDGSTTRRAGGMGLGLALVDGIVRRMGGQVEATSRVGHGTRIRLRLPVG